MARHDAGALRESGLLYRFSSLQLYASGFAAVAMGIAPRRARRFYRTGPRQDPARHPLPNPPLLVGEARVGRDNNVVQSQVAQAEAKLGAARAFLFGALQQITGEVARTGVLTLDQRMTIRLAATFAIHQACDVVDDVYHTAGATAIFTANPFERRFRDIHTVSQQLQGRQTHYETVGHYLLGLVPDNLMWL
jgi:alkylation response protein AidB-like acyl-CoA dehydrogenase